MKQKLPCILTGMAVFMINTLAVGQFIAGNLHLSHNKAAQNYSSSYMQFSLKSRHSLNNINLNAVRDFLRRYKGEETGEVTWQIAQDGGFIARFSVDSVDNIAAYGKRGNWLHTIRRYSESHLPGSIRSLVKDKYYNYSIAHVDEVSVPVGKNPVYIISVQNDSEIKILNVYNGEIEVKRTLLK